MGHCIVKEECGWLGRGDGDLRKGCWLGGSEVYRGSIGAIRMVGGGGGLSV